MTLTASSQHKTLKLELPKRDGTVRVGGMDMPLELLENAAYRNWTDGDIGVVAYQAVEKG